MSFDVFLQRFGGGKPAEVSREPVLAVLRTTKFRGPDDFGVYVVEFPDGQEVERSAEGLQGPGAFKDCSFEIHGMSPHLVRFMFEVAKAGDMVMLPAMEDFVPILSRPEQRKELPEDLAGNEPEPVGCDSPEELDLLLSGGYAGCRSVESRFCVRTVGSINAPEPTATAP
ncbi:MAG: hypothetical protein ABSE16_21125 [Verrucomicrobiota bacterium]|jgi:hypothetical protein